MGQSSPYKPMIILLASPLSILTSKYTLFVTIPWGSCNSVTGFFSFGRLIMLMMIMIIDDYDDNDDNDDLPLVVIKDFIW